MKKKMAFVDLTNYKDWPMGGMLEYELAILGHLVNEYDVEIWGVSLDGKANDEIKINGKVYPIHIWGNAKTSRRIIPNYYRGLSIYLQKNKFPKDYDVVYAHTGSCIVALNHMIDCTKTKLVYHQHGLNHRNDYSLMSLLQRPFLAKAQKLADLVLVVSDPESVATFAEKMKNKSKARFAPIGSPVNLSKFDCVKARKKIEERASKKTKNFLYTGRLSKFKDVRTLIDAMHRYITEINEEATLIVAGAGDEFENLKQLISDYELVSNIKLLGPVAHDKVYELLQDADVFLTASGGEGVSVSVLEAYAAGLPVVCFEVSGLERQIKNGVTGVFAKERTADSFFEAMVYLDGIRVSTALNCLDEARKYDSAGITKQIMNEIESLF